MSVAIVLSKCSQIVTGVLVSATRSLEVAEKFSMPTATIAKIQTPRRNRTKTQISKTTFVKTKCTSWKRKALEYKFEGIPGFALP
eukprot:182038-Amphidinium_carterae.1